MTDTDRTKILKEKLLSAGIDEIAAHGAEDFSLRRVAAACGASCAAPYKHFKNKEEFIQATIQYIDEKWNRLSRQIVASFDDPCERIPRLCAANVRFKLANPLYSMGGQSFTPSITDEIRALCKRDGRSDESMLLFSVSAMVSGTAWLISSGKLENSQDVMDLLMQKVSEEISPKDNHEKEI